MEVNDHTQRGVSDKAENANMSSSPIQVCRTMAGSPPFYRNAHGRIGPAVLRGRWIRIPQPHRPIGRPRGRTYTCTASPAPDVAVG